MSAQPPESDLRNAPEAPPATPAVDPAEESARRHYRRGNRLFEQKAWDQALQEWRRAWRIWVPGGEAGAGAVRRSLASVRAVLLLLATVMAVYYLIFTFFPRDPFDLMMIGGGQLGEPQSWWEQFLDTGRPGGGDTHKMGVREWWERFRDRHGWGRDDELAQGNRLRPTIDERWADLLRRYGRWGPLTLDELDLKVVSGYGLTSLGDYPRAVEVLKEAVSSTSDPDRLGELYQTLATAYYFEGYHLQKDRLATYDLRLVKLSAQAYEKAIQFRPQVLSYGNLGWAYFLLGEYDRSEKYSLRALAYDDSLDYVRLNLGLLYMARGRLRESFLAYRRVAVRYPADETFMGGINDLKEVLRDQPGRHPFAHLMIGYLSLQRGDLPTARKHLHAYLSSPGTETDWQRLAQRWLMDPASALEG